MPPEDSFQDYLRAGLESFGIEVDEVEMAVISAAWRAFEPPIRELLEADLDGVEPEFDFHPSRAPSR